MKDEDANSLSRRMSSSINELNGSTLPNTAHNTTSSPSGLTTLSPYPTKSCNHNHMQENKFEFSSEITERSVHHWADKYPSEENEHKKLEDDDDRGGDGDGGGDSDSSSDLFDLPNRELLDCYSTGLPVYGTTKCISSSRVVQKFLPQ